MDPDLDTNPSPQYSPAGSSLEDDDGSCYRVGMILTYEATTILQVRAVHCSYGMNIQAPVTIPSS